MVTLFGIGERNVESLQFFVFQVAGKLPESFLASCFNNRTGQQSIKEIIVGFTAYVVTHLVDVKVFLVGGHDQASFLHQADNLFEMRHLFERQVDHFTHEIRFVGVVSDQGHSH